MVLAFFIFSIFLNRDFGCIKTRIYNLFGLSVLNSTFICRSTITTDLGVSRKLPCYCACVLSNLAAILFWWTEWPSFLCSFRMASISHQYLYFLKRWFWRGCKTFSSCENIYFSVLHSDFIVCGNLFLFFLWGFSLFLFILTEWDFFSSNFWVYWGGKSFSWDGLRYNHNHYSFQLLLLVV